MSNENHPGGYRQHDREPIGYRAPAKRRQDHQEIYAPDWDELQLREQATRCMDCGVPTCTSGCPIGNIIPDWNDLVSRGDWRTALARLHATNNFPEFTGYACPAPCEDACTLNYNLQPVTIKDLERAIVDRGWEAGWIVPQPPPERSGLRVAVVGSGPAGLACAQQLNRAGHRVTVFERDDAPGGLVCYGIPDFKFSKDKLERRIGQLTAEGIVFRCSTELGRDVSLSELRAGHDAVGLTIGALHPRDVELPGRELDGIHFAMPYLVRENRRQAGREQTEGPDAAGRNVIVLGGGDTGADCVATALRQGAASVTQININERPPRERADDNPWPLVARTYKTSYALAEGADDEFSLDTLAFEDNDGNGHVDCLHTERVRWVRDQRGRRVDKHVHEADRRLPTELVLVAIGFSRPQTEALNAPELALDDNGTFATDGQMMTSVPGVFAGGDCNMGHSLLVWAIGEGRDLARSIDQYLAGTSRLPPSLRTSHRPLQPDSWDLTG
ncbi:glutamate synthase subunit beta [Salinisphaera sp. LB1]|uniref:glutamate synthase subunit beta n=1 Tax=Salinisphaera sp. LB1 TaxID=2183911 RepID=UPI000D705C4A|nr:glutamate synthase subunit beta [Salinisphaera sp. LB1]AWN17924.1 Glutamate synthase [NADPH] small chain [Salinisphaera sp. LB1]